MTGRAALHQSAGPLHQYRRRSSVEKKNNPTCWDASEPLLHLIEVDCGAAEIVN
jgi:hypothetical protein